MTDAASRELSECVGKQAFPTKAAAIWVAARRKWRANVYRCDFCHDYHIGNERLHAK